jgi:hypothetical protein
MWRPAELGTGIAQRELTLKIGEDTRAVSLRIGVPVRSPAAEEGKPGWCPMQWDGFGPADTLLSIAGEDSLQVRALALDAAQKLLPHYAEQLGGTLWAEAGDLDVISPQRDLVEAYGRPTGEGMAAVRSAEAALRDTQGSALASMLDRLLELVQRYGER